ncbi:hypothetical protein B1756_14275 [Natrarchaeobaculum aegyptiacum]|uniref:eCIS core domain-containing protein n=1 Tax=Natrarchaeobaculum aegyptiacum TaxID=745377 RepID=A0A2Z2HWW9_9EURY|nr:hypothetical protein B1756_14275 [Natrarchaeobaculum aegyptiacum]
MFGRDEAQIQRSLEGTNTAIDEVPGKVLDVLSNGGQPLDQPVQRALEERMDADFSDVRIHTGGTAAKAAEAIDAKAFTCGNDIVFNSGEYDPESPEGQHLLAHELAHVTQQNGGAPISMMPQEGADLEIDPDPQLEREADAAAEQALSGEEPLVVNRMGAEVHIQRSVKGALSSVAEQVPGIGSSEQESDDDLELQELDDGDLAETVGTLVENQREIMSHIKDQQSEMVDKVGEATGKGAVGGTVGLAVGAVTANPVIGAIAGGMASDLGKTLYGQLYDRGTDAIADAEVPEVSADCLSGIRGTIDQLIDEKLRQRFGGVDTGSTRFG